jgi:gamma-glutamyltranspeptidase/glutathione hydrolase
VVLAQVLRVIEGYELRDMGHNSADYLHLLTEAMKHAYADRAHHLGDPDFVDVPVARLIGDGRVEEVRRAIWPGRSFAPEHYGSLIAPPRDAGTQHISVVDQHGGAVALTTTVNTSFGSGQVVESLGLVLNNEMDDFSSAPGVPNAYGLVGSVANAIEPGKRPLSSMSPTVVLDGEGTVVLVLGASGGSRIISGTLQALLNVLVFEIDVQEAVALPRIHHQWQPDRLVVDFGISDETVRALEARGHHVQRKPHRSKCGRVDGAAPCYGAVQAVAVSDGVAEGGSDPRKGGRPAAAN